MLQVIVVGSRLRIDWELKISGFQFGSVFDKVCIWVIEVKVLGSVQISVVLFSKLSSRVGQCGCRCLISRLSVKLKLFISSDGLLNLVNCVSSCQLFFGVVFFLFVVRLRRQGSWLRMISSVVLRVKLSIIECEMKLISDLMCRMLSSYWKVLVRKVSSSMVWMYCGLFSGVSGVIELNSSIEIVVVGLFIRQCDEFYRQVIVIGSIVVYRLYFVGRLVISVQVIDCGSVRIVLFRLI